MQSIVVFCPQHYCEVGGRNSENFLCKIPSASLERASGALSASVARLAPAGRSLPPSSQFEWPLRYELQLGGSRHSSLLLVIDHFANVVGRRLIELDVHQAEDKSCVNDVVFQDQIPPPYGASMSEILLDAMNGWNSAGHTDLLMDLGTQLGHQGGSRVASRLKETLVPSSMAMVSLKSNRSQRQSGISHS